MGIRFPHRWLLSGLFQCSGPHRLSLCLPLWRRLLRSKCQVELQASLPMQGPARAALESNSLTVVPPAVDGNPRRRQECTRAWSRPRSAQTSARRQVRSACPHSCCFLFLFGATVTMCCAVKEEFGTSSLRVRFSPEQSGFIENILAFFPVLNPHKKRREKKNPAHVAPIFHILCFGTRESISTLRVPASLGKE